MTKTEQQWFALLHATYEYGWKLYMERCEAMLGIMAGRIDQAYVAPYLHPGSAAEERPTVH